MRLTLHASRHRRRHARPRARITCDYWTAVRRGQRLPVPEHDKVLVPADLEGIYRRAGHTPVTLSTESRLERRRSLLSAFREINSLRAQAQTMREYPEA